MSKAEVKKAITRAISPFAIVYLRWLNLKQENAQKGEPSRIII